MAEADKKPKPRINVPMLIAIAIAAGGIAGLLLVDHGPWNKPVAEGPATAHYTDTAAAAKAAGATIAPTDPAPILEPAAPGPKPAQPAVPVTKDKS
jgi:hypothetical protein